VANMTKGCSVRHTRFSLLLLLHPKLWLKFYWYKWIKKLDIIGFYAGVPIIRAKYLEEDKEKKDEETNMLPYRS